MEVMATEGTVTILDHETQQRSVSTEQESSGDSHITQPGVEPGANWGAPPKFSPAAGLAIVATTLLGMSTKVSSNIIFLNPKSICISVLYKSAVPATHMRIDLVLPVTKTVIVSHQPHSWTRRGYGIHPSKLICTTISCVYPPISSIPKL